MAEEKEVEELTKDNPSEDKSLTLYEKSQDVFLKLLKEQFALSWEEQKKLIRSDSPQTRVGVMNAVRVAQQLGLPLNGIDVIHDQVYVNAEGIRCRLALDSRGIRSNKSRPVHFPTKDEPWVVFETVIVMGDDSEFNGFGSVNCSPSGDVGNSIMKSETKSGRRAGVKATATPLPIAEDIMDWLDEQKHSKGPTIEGAFREVPLTTTEPTNLAELLAWAGKCGKTMDDITAVVGDIMQITDFSAAVKKLREVWRL